MSKYNLQQLAEVAGIHFIGATGVMPEGVRLRKTENGGIACDAQPTLITTSSSGIPSFLANYIDPKIIQTLVSPMKAAEVVGSEVKKGDWTTLTAQFPMIEHTGQTSSYGDYSNSGSVGNNFQYPTRQSYTYQVVTTWGERELEMAGLGKIDLAAQRSIASVLTLNKFQNQTYFFGVSGLQCRGLLNDSDLPAAIAPITKAATGTSWSNATAREKFLDVKKLYVSVATTLNGNLDPNAKMTLAMSPISQGNLADVTDFNVSAVDMIKKNFPNMTIKVAPEYTTASGEYLQLIVDEIDGQRTADVAFTEKLRAHPIKVELSSFQQKKSQGTWGAIIYRPAAVGLMLGI